MPPVQSTPTSDESSKAVGGQGTNTHVGESKAKEPSQHNTTQPMLATKWKPGSALPPESSSTSTTKKEPSSLPCDEEYKEEVVQRKHELEGYLEAQGVPPKKKTKKNRGGKQKSVPTEIHLRLRAAADAERKWEQDLKEVNGLSDREVSMCIGIVAKHHKSDSFPDSDPEENQKYLDLAREGWGHFREGYKLSQKYPECLDQTFINGQWYMQDEL